MIMKTTLKEIRDNRNWAINAAKEYNKTATEIGALYKVWDLHAEDVENAINNGLIEVIQTGYSCGIYGCTGQVGIVLDKTTGVFLGYGYCTNPYHSWSFR